jgi:hypothetical protein
MNQVVRRTMAPDIFEGRALTLKVLNARRTLGSSRLRPSAVRRTQVRNGRGQYLVRDLG